MPNIKTVQADLRVLVKHSKEDAAQNRWASYITHIPEFNRLLEACQQLGIDVEGIEPIEDVPKESRGVTGPGSAEERAKVSEVARKSEQLYGRACQP